MFNEINSLNISDIVTLLSFVIGLLSLVIAIKLIFNARNLWKNDVNEFFQSLISFKGEIIDEEAMEILHLDLGAKVFRGKVLVKFELNTLLNKKLTNISIMQIVNQMKTENKWQNKFLSKLVDGK